MLQKSSQPEIHLKERLRPVTPSLNEIKFYADDQLTEDLDILKGLLAHTHPGMTIAELVRYLADLGLKKLDPARKPSRSNAAAATTDSSNTGSFTAAHSSTRPTAASSNTNLTAAGSSTSSTVGSDASLAASSSTGFSSTTSSPAATSSDSKTTKSFPAPEMKSAPTRYIPARDKREVWKQGQGRCGFKDPKTGRICGSRYWVQFDHIIPFALGGPNTKENLRLRCATHNRLHAEQAFGRWVMQQYR